MPAQPLYLGIAFTDDYCEMAVIDEQRKQHAMAIANVDSELPDEEQSPADWLAALDVCWQSMLTQLDAAQVNAEQIIRISTAAPGHSLLLSDAFGKPITNALTSHHRCEYPLYARMASRIPKKSAVGGDRSNLLKLIALLEQSSGQSVRPTQQAEWLNTQLCGEVGICDEHNATLLGYDAIKQTWPKWIEKLTQGQSVFPQVVTMGTVLGPISSTFADRYQLPRHIQVAAGSSSETATFLSTGLSQPGASLTTLDDYLQLQTIASMPVFNSEYGIYSHRLASRWLVCATANTGPAGIYRYLPETCVQTLLDDLQPNKSFNLDLYPLPSVGEQFPLADSRMRSITEPRPKDDAEFLQALLESIADAEHDGYWLLKRLGATIPTEIFTTRSFGNHPHWLNIRHNRVKIPIHPLQKTPSAALGCALIAAGQI